MDEFSFGDRKSYPQVGTQCLDAAKVVFKSSDIRTYRVRADRDGEVIDIQNRQTLGDSRVEAGYIEHKKERRNRRALRGANSDWAEDLRCALEYESALVSGEERLDPGNQVSGDTSSDEDSSQLVCTDVVKSTCDIQEESRYFEGSGLKQADFMGESSDSLETAQTSQGPTLSGVQEAKAAVGGGKMKSRKSFEDFGDTFELDNDAKESWCTIIRFAWFIQDNAVGLLHG